MSRLEGFPLPRGRVILTRNVIIPIISGLVMHASRSDLWQVCGLKERASALLDTFRFQTQSHELTECGITKQPGPPSPLKSK